MPIRRSAAVWACNIPFHPFFRGSFLLRSKGTVFSVLPVISFLHRSFLSLPIGKEYGIISDMSRMEVSHGIFPSLYGNMKDE